MSTNTENSSPSATDARQTTGTGGTGPVAFLRRGVLAAGVLTIGVLAGTGPVLAHEEDYYPDDSTVTSIPDTARSLIEESSGGGSTTLIYAGIAILGLAGFAVLALNMVKGRNVTNTAGDDAGDAGSGTE